MSVTITYSTELMKNYKQAEIMAPDASFAALQSADGNALLFSIGNDGVCYLTREVRGAQAGWRRSVLSGSLGSAKVKQIAVAQNRVTGNIDLALVLAGTPADQLYVSLGNSDSDLGWIASPAWQALPFDATQAPSPLVIANVFISEAGDGEYWVADLLRDPDAPAPVIARYFIDPTKKLTRQAWNPHDVAGDIEAASARSCLGRRKGDRVDGIYTLGTVVGHPQLAYQPLYNPFRPTVAANPVALAVPLGATQGTALVAIASDASDANATDLFVCYGQSICCYPADGQQQGGSGITILDNPLLQGVTRLFGYAGRTNVTLWGLNQANQIFYTSCPKADVHNPSAWSVPVPIFQGAEQVSPYLNRANDGNVFFVHSGVDVLQRAVQAPDTTTWKLEKVLLAAPSQAPSIKTSSYTTRLQVIDENKQPVPGLALQIGAKHRTGAYINGLYYVLDTTPIPVSTDALGSVNIIEWVEDLTATPLKVIGPNGTTIAINPMDKPFQKAASLSTADALRSATVPNADGSPGRPLVPSSTSSSDVTAAAAALGQLHDIYQGLPADGSIASRRTVLPGGEARFVKVASLVSVRAGAGAATHPDLRVDGILDPIEVLAGDLLRWLEDATDYVVHIVKDAATDVWHFVVQIADAVYSFVLDAVDKVVGALVAIYNAIKTAIEDLIAFLEFLFEWKSFVRTRQVFSTFVSMGLQTVIDNLGTLKTEFNGLISSARSNVDNWAEIKSDTWQPAVPNNAQPLGFMRTAGVIVDTMTAPAMFLYHHLIDNVGNSQSADPGKGTTGSTLIDEILTALENQGDIFIGAITRLKSELIDGSAFESMSLGDILKKLVAIVVDAFLDSTENIVDLLLDLAAALLQAALDDLRTPVWIPVVSDILKDFGVSIDFSILDVIMMVAAIPATLAYKLATGSAPFSEGDGFSDRIIAAGTPAQLNAAISATARTQAIVHSESKALSDDPEPTIGFGPLTTTLAPSAIETIYAVGHTVAGIGSFISAVLTPGLLISEGDGATWDRAFTAASLTTAVANGLAAFIDSPKAIKDPDMYRMAKACTLLTLAGKALGGTVAKKVYGDNVTPEQSAKVTKGFDAIIAFVALTPSVYHFQELAQDAASSARSSAIVGETAAIVNSIGRITTFFAVIDEDRESKAILGAAVAILSIIYGGLQFAEAAISPTGD